MAAPSVTIPLYPRFHQTDGITAGDILDALRCCRDEAKLSLEALRLVRLTPEEQRRIDGAATDARNLLRAVQIQAEARLA